MQALRQRAACAARQIRPTSAIRNARGYASGHGHDHHHAAPEVQEGLGTAFYIFAGILPTSAFFYSISRPGPDGEPSSLTKYLNQFEALNVDNMARNEARTIAIEQAAHDKHLFLNAGGKSPHIELTTPELFNSGSPWNVPAGHYINLDHVTEHYRQQYLADEERKAKKLAAKAAKEA